MRERMRDREIETQRVRTLSWNRKIVFKQNYFKY